MPKLVIKGTREVWELLNPLKRKKTKKTTCFSFVVITAIPEVSVVSVLGLYPLVTN